MASAAQKLSVIDGLVLQEPPPLHPVWLQYEKDNNLPTPPCRTLSPLERQPIYADECRDLTFRMTAPGTRDQHLAEGIAVQPFTVSSSVDGFSIPLLEYRRQSAQATAVAAAEEKVEEKEKEKDTKEKEQKPRISNAINVVVYIHGGGLHVGEADSEELTCRRILKEADLPDDDHNKNDSRGLVLYSIGYRLMPQYTAKTCLADCLDAFRFVRTIHPRARLLLVGSSSGGELAALVSQQVKNDVEPSQGLAAIQGVVLRCPVTSDAFHGEEYVPAALRPYHTSATNLAFQSSLLGPMHRLVPRDGLSYMPLEAPVALIKGQPRHWIQLCTNDMLYSDSLCYAKVLEDAGTAVRLSVARGWPHTFWLKVPWMPEALEMERAMLEGLAWVARG